MPQLASTPRERDGTDVPAQGARPARDRGDACPGALRLHSADDGALARIRIPAGLLNAPQAHALAETAARMGDGHVDITSRGNLQLRGLDGQKGAELAARLDEAGLLPSPRHERVRNIVASPLSGLDGLGHADVRPWAARLDELLCRSEDASRLSGRFLFALDDGRGDAAGLEADVTLIALPGRSEALLRVGDGPEGMRVPAEDAPAAALLAAETFLTAVRESGSRVWRVSELPQGREQFTPRLARRLSSRGIPARLVTGLSTPAGSPPPPGVVDGGAGRCALSVLAPLGRLTSAQLHRLASLAEQFTDADGGDANGELRVTPWRGVVLPGLPRADAQAGLRQLHDAGLITDGASPWLGVSACTGLPGCARSHRDVRSDAARPAAGTPAGTSLLPVHWSGCERRCGRPKGDVVDVVAGEDGYTVAVQAEGSTRERPVPDGELAHAVASARAERE